ncbi:MAG TPA: hypothetical protein P5274_02095, partial [Candidatus Paceibacterota bacterium]|nr:hypothetical protein [Candidatus Paceibacterota bacterium]
KQVKTNADKILSGTNLVDILSGFGQVKMRGAYDLDLMYGPDIDIVVLNDNPRESSVKALQKLIDLRLFQKYEYGDFEKFKRAKRPESFIIVLKVEHENVKWEIEIWFLKDIDKEEIEFIDKLKKILTPEVRLEILRQKDEREKGGLDKHKLSSFEIYQTFLSND